MGTSLRSNKYFLVVIIVLTALNLWPGTAIAENNAADFPFQPGEKLVYLLKWGLIPAGCAELTILPSQEINDEMTWRFQFTARTNSFVDVFFKVRDYIESKNDAGLRNSLSYKKNQHEGSTKRKILIEFSPEKHLMQYTKNGKKADPALIPPGTLDPLASFYYVRRHLSKVGQNIDRPVTDGKTITIGRAKVLKREKIMVGDRQYDTFLVEPDLKNVGGVFEKNTDSKIQLWITTDQRRLLVRVQSKVVIGSFTADLVEYENLTGS
ncbi:MAG: DUF3108 domain-containing protein [Proteobacteria bacterium]|nr:DUF3108 domain-containing protein [Pseudomonadota bacterium]MBU1714320.1 DUF3108 domain-containing protein [Pseudomonadota bacterium]